MSFQSLLSTELTADPVVTQVVSTGGGGWVGTATSNLNMSNYNVTNVSQVNTQRVKMQGPDTLTSSQVCYYDSTSKMITIGPSWFSTAATDLNMNTKSVTNANVITANKLTLSNLVESQKPHVLYYDQGLGIVSYGSSWVGTAPANLDMNSFNLLNAGSVVADTLTVSNLSQVSTSNVVYYDSGSGVFSYGPAGSGGGWTGLATTNLDMGTYNITNATEVRTGKLYLNNPQTLASTQVLYYTSNTKEVSVADLTIPYLKLNALKVAIGDTVMSTDSNIATVQLGREAGKDGGQGDHSIAIGTAAGYYTLGQQSIAIGNNAGFQSMGSKGVAIGLDAAKTSAGINVVCIGEAAGKTSPAESSISIGTRAGETNIAGTRNINIGYQANQIQTVYGNTECIAIGSNSGGHITITGTAPATGSVAIGTNAGQSAGPGNVAIGLNAGVQALGSNVAIGSGAGQGVTATSGGVQGYYKQGYGCTAVGANAARYGQNSYSTSIGNAAGFGVVTDGILTLPGGYGTHVGQAAGQTSGTYVVAVGAEAGKTSQAGGAVAIGAGAGKNSQGASSVAIGRVCCGNTNLTSAQAANCIAISATGAENGNGFGMTSNACFIKPIRAGAMTTAFKMLGYNDTSGELVANSNYGFSASGKPLLIGLDNTLTSNVLYYDSGTGAVTYAAAPTGGGGGWVGTAASNLNMSTYNITGVGSLAFNSNTIALNSGTTPGANSVSIGAGHTGSIGQNSVVIGHIFFNGCNDGCVVIGAFINYNQDQLSIEGQDCVIIGRSSAINGAATGAVSIGALANSVAAGASSVSIGVSSGASSTSGIAIGNLARSGHSNSIVLNATGVQLNSAAANACHIAPIRTAPETTSGLQQLCYDTSSSEVFQRERFLYQANLQSIANDVAAVTEVKLGSLYGGWVPQYTRGTTSTVLQNTSRFYFPRAGIYHVEFYYGVVNPKSRMRFAWVKTAGLQDIYHYVVDQNLAQESTSLFSYNFQVTGTAEYFEIYWFNQHSNVNRMTSLCTLSINELT